MNAVEVGEAGSAALSGPGLASVDQWPASSAASIETRISSNGVTLTCATLSGSKKNALCF